MVTRRLVSNFDNVLRAKAYFFVKKSVWRYLIAAVILGYVQPIRAMDIIPSAVLYFLGILLIVLPLLYFSAKKQGKSINFDAEVTFDNDQITIQHLNKDLTETKDWSWVKEIECRKNRIWLIVNQKAPFGITLTKDRLSAEEIAFFEAKAGY